MATNWIVPTVDDAQAYCAQAVVDAANEKNSGGTKRLETILENTIARVRACCRSSWWPPSSPAATAATRTSSR